MFEADRLPQLLLAPLLRLPDELLLLIFDQVRLVEINHSGTRKILINHRIYRLACPIWFGCLQIRDDQLDRRLARLLNNNANSEARRFHLRSLDVPLTNSHYNLFISAISNLPNLSRLTLDIDKGINTESIVAAADGISLLPKLEELVLECEELDPTTDLYNRYTLNRPDHAIVVRTLRDCRPQWNRESKGGSLYKIELQTEESVTRVQPQIDWSNLVSLGVKGREGREGSLQWVDTVFWKFEKAIVRWSSLANFRKLTYFILRRNAQPCSKR